MRQIFYIFLFVIFFCRVLPAHAQLPFHQVTQVPLLVNPSLAGSKAQKRIAMAGSFYSRKLMLSELQTRSTLLSYDQLVKKIGTGVGFYFLHHRIHETITSRLNSGTDISDFSVGLAFAPKYNVYHNKNTFDKIKFTISPSVLLEYSPSRQLLTNHDSRSSMNILYASWSPHPTQYFHSDSIQSTNVRMNTRIFRAGLGLQINTEKFMILYKVIHETENAKEHASVNINSVSTNQTTSVMVDLHQRYYSINQSLNLGRTFSSANNWFSFTPFIGLGLRHYLNVIPYPVERDLANYYYSKSQKNSKTEFSYAHLSLNFRTGKFLFGTAFTSDGKYHTNFGGTIGFQSKSVRIMATFGVPLYKVSGELSASIYF